MLAGPSAPEESSETSCYTRSEILMGCLLKDATGKKNFGNQQICLKRKSTQMMKNVNRRPGMRL